jgi:hypothetical protein
MKILIACERSGIVRDAFIARGHEAISCDLEPSRRPGPHYQGDVRDILGDAWDMLIAHPVCRYMANSGVRWLHTEPGRWDKMREGCEFFLALDRAIHIPRRCIENSIMHGHALKIIGRKATQHVQPWMFGDPFKKAAAIWLHGLPKLTPTHSLSDYLEPPKQKCWLMGPSDDREEKRSQTEHGLAAAMALQWG